MGLRPFRSGVEEDVPTEHEETVRQQILDGLIADMGGDQQVSTATWILAEIIASDAAWFMVFSGLSTISSGVIRRSGKT